MRHLASSDVEGPLRRGRSVEQFMGRGTGEATIRLVELRPVRAGVEVWVHEYEDAGDEEWLDIYAFPHALEESEQVPAAVLPDAAAAIEHAHAALGCLPIRWVNQGVAQEEYLDFVRAGRALSTG